MHIIEIFSRYGEEADLGLIDSAVTNLPVDVGHGFLFAKIQIRNRVNQSRAR